MKLTEVTTTYYTPFGESKEFKHYMHVELEQVRKTGCLELNKNSDLYFIYIDKDKLCVTCDSASLEVQQSPDGRSVEYFTFREKEESGIGYNFRVKYIQADGYVVSIVEACEDLPEEDKAYAVLLSDEVLKENEDLTNRSKFLMPSVFATTNPDPEFGDMRDFLYDNPVIPCGDSMDREWRNINDFILWSYRNSSSFRNDLYVSMGKYGENSETIFGRILEVEPTVVKGIFPIINDVLFSCSYWINGDNSTELIKKVENAYGPVASYFRSLLKTKGLIEYCGNATVFGVYLLDLCKLAEE